MTRYVRIPVIECHVDGTPLVEEMSKYLNQPKRSEAEARTARPKVHFYQGETFERMERRLFRENREAFDLAISMARTAIEDANMGPDALKYFDGHVSDFCGDFWNVDPRKED